MDKNREELRVGPGVYCEKHHTKAIEFYCKKEDKLICQLCLLEHNDHINQVTPCSIKEIKNLAQYLLEQLNCIKEQIEFKLKNIKLILSDTLTLLASDIMEEIYEIKHFILTPMVFEEVFLTKLSSQRLINLKNESKLIKCEEEIQKLNDWL